MKLNVGIFNESFPPTIDGVSNAAFNYAKYIQQNHGTCTAVTPKYPHVVDNYPFEVYRYSSADIAKNIGYRIGNMFSVKMIHDLHNKHFDIIHVHSPFVSSIIAAELKKMRNVPVVFTYHTKFDIEITARIKARSFYKTAQKFILGNISRADEVWVVSEGAVQSLRNIGYTGPYRVMPNGTDFPKGVASDEKIAELKSEYNIADDERVFLFVGRMRWYKNIGLILEALQKLPENIKYKMLFVGDGPDRPAIEEYAKQLGIYDKTVFTGAVRDRDKMRVFFSASDLFLFPSTYDTAGLVVKEAAACDVPSILVEGSCAAEDVVDDFSGYLCDENPDSFCEKLAYALSDDEKLKKTGKNAAEYVYLSWEDAVARAYKRYCELYKEFHSGKVKKSAVEKMMPSNIGRSVKKNVYKGFRAGRNTVIQGTDYAKSVGRASKSVAGSVSRFAKGIGTSVKSGIKGNDIVKDVPIDDIKEDTVNTENINNTDTQKGEKQ